MPDRDRSPRPTRLFALVRPELMRWARETAGLAVEDAARKIGVKPDRLQDWETEDRQRPTVPQLRNAARVYKRPLAVFFMSRPPAEPSAPHDFRRFPNEDVPPTSTTLAFAMRRARRRRRVALELMDELEIRPRDFQLRATLRDDPERIAARVRELLNVSLEQQRSWRTDSAALGGWITAIEAQDVLVFQESRISVDEMRGFSISESPLPVITLNAADLPRARAFTLLHEFAHLVLNLSGICEPQRARARGRTDDERVEVFANHVAGAVLVPADALLTHQSVSARARQQDWAETTIQSLATYFSVSREVILRRLLILDRTTEDFYEQKRAEYLAQYRMMAQRRAESEEGGFAPYHLVVLRNNGRRYTSMVVSAFEDGHIAPGDFVDYLGVSLEHLPDIAGALRRRGASEG